MLSASRLDESAREHAIASPDRAGLRDDEPVCAVAFRSLILAHARTVALESPGVPAGRSTLLLLAERLNLLRNVAPL